jgi:tRNA(Ile2) C34 agmatinyltransferase TiaS
MIKKTPYCIYCGERMESLTAKKKYCSDKCRVYFHREYPNGKTISPVELASKLKVNSKMEQEYKKENKVSKNEPKEGSLAWFIKNS